MKYLCLSLIMFFSITYSQAQSEETIKTKNPLTIKAQPYGIFNGVFKLAIEKSYTEKTSYEFELGFIDDEAFNENTNNDLNYAFIQLRLKRYILQQGPQEGIYLAPNISFGTSEILPNTSINKFIDLSRNSNIYGCILVDVGYQTIFQQVAVDLFAGGGISMNNANGKLAHNNYSHYTNRNLALKAGVRIGISTKK